MEGAVRSGYLAAEAVARVNDVKIGDVKIGDGKIGDGKIGGKSARFLVPDLAPRGLMRLFG
jgi:hypothetical protein